MVDDVTTDTNWNALYIDGEWTESESGESVTIEDPSTHRMVAHVPRGTEANVDATYETAAEAQEPWAEAPPARRQEVVEQFLQALNEHEDEIIDLLAHKVSGSRTMGETSIQTASDHAGEAATLSRRMRDEHVASNTLGKESIVQKNPKDVVTVISPWSFPLDLPMRAIASAAAVGNAVILEPSTNFPATGGLLLARLFEETDLPEGVINVVTGRGSEIGNRVASHPESDMVTFAGSTEVGKRVSDIASENLAVPAMELGGDDAHVVTGGTDVGRTTDAAVFGSLIHQRQVCISINRHIVHESAYDEYVERLTERAAELPVGSIHRDNTVIGPIIDESQRDEMPGYVEETVAAGATLETGGSTAGLDGVDGSLVVQLIVLSGMTNDMAAARNEHFDPIVPVIPFSGVDEAIEPANATEYGLSGSIHAGDLATGKETALRMGTGNVHVSSQPINDEARVPFSGTGVSGVGTYNNDTFLDEVTGDKWISLQHKPRDYPL